MMFFLIIIIQEKTLSYIIYKINKNKSTKSTKSLTFSLLYTFKERGAKVEKIIDFF